MILLLVQILFSLLAARICFAFIKYLLYQNEFRAQGISGPPCYPVLGTSLWSMIRKGVWKTDKIFIEKYGNILAITELGVDKILTIDVEIIKEVWVKQFDNFRNRKVNKLEDEIANKMVSNAQGEDWKRIRSAITPTFSSGKMKMMVEPLQRSSKRLLESALKMQKEGTALDIKKLANCYSFDAVAEIAFGLSLNSFENPNSDFVKHGTATFQSVERPTFRVILLIKFPKLANFLGKYFGFENTFFKRETMQFFSKISREIFQKVSSEDTESSNFIHLMAKANKENWSDSQNLKMTEDEIIAQAIVFFIAGFQTLSDTIMFLLYCLAKNQKCQNLVREEILKYCGENDDASYEDLQHMKYLDSVIEETMRLYPVGYRNERIATSNAVVKGISIKKGSVVSVPIYMLNKSPDLWEEPEEFRPERFMTEDKPFIMPFGLGPRNCIAQRLALLEVKCAVVTLLARHRFKVHSSMEEPIVLAKTFVVKPVSPIFLEIEKIEN